MMSLRTKRLTLCALYCAIGLTIFVLEAQIPPFLPVPGFRLGLSNIVTLLALVTLGWKEAAAISLVRIVLGNLVTGQGMAMLYSLGGGLLGFLAMALSLKVLKDSQIWAAGILGALGHNLGQMLVAVAVAQTPELFLYLPVLLLCGMVTGAFTGLCVQLIKNKKLMK